MFFMVDCRDAKALGQRGLGDVALGVELAHQEHLPGGGASQVRIFTRGPTAGD